MKKKPKQQKARKHLEIVGWDYDDGSVGAELTGSPGEFWARDDETLLEGVTYLISLFDAYFEHKKGGIPSKGMIDLQAQVALLEGRIVVRWPAIVGFGIDFASKQELQEFVNTFMRMYLPPSNSLIGKARYTHD